MKSRLHHPVLSDEAILADAEERRRALDPSLSFHLEAPAGSGKTFLLAARFLCLLAIVDHPQQILALTFTNKAAGEMMERVGGYLLKARSGIRPSNDIEAKMIEAASSALKRHSRYQDLLLAGGFLRIQTFHSFCYSLVSQAPLEAGIVPGSSLLVEPDQIFFLREVIDETLAAIAQRSQDDPWCRALENRLLYLNNSWALLVRELEELMGRRESILELLQVADRRRAADYVEQGIRKLVEAELEALRRSFEHTALGRAWPEFIRDLEIHGAGAVKDLPGRVPGAVWEELPRWRAISDALLTQKGGPRKKFGPATGFYSGFARTDQCEMIQCLDASTLELLFGARELPLPGSGMPDLDSLWDLVLLLHAVMEAYESRCRAGRLLDFSALETAALRLFDHAQPTDLQLLLDQQIHHVLIDEFQDTNYQQWSLLQRLCTAWAPEDGRTLFVVGDPKQSIYGFRKAEVRLFREARKGVPLDAFRTLPLEPLVLQTNFRSGPHLIDWCNELFERTVMIDPKEELDEVPFTRSAASPTTVPVECPQAPELALFVGWPDLRVARQREAAWMARSIKQEIEKDDGSSEIGILLFTRAHLPVYLEALQRCGISVQVAEGLKLLERPEARYLWQLCRALVLPHDDLAWVTQLRSPWLSLSYAELLAVSSEEPEAWVEKIRKHADRSGKVAGLWERLRGARQHLGHKPLADVVEDVWVALGGARIAARMWGSRGLAACRQFFRCAREAEAHEPVQTLMRLEQLLEHAYEPINPETMVSNVLLMTVHRAKGLEFDTVYLPYLDWNPVAREKRDKPPYLLERVPGTSAHYLLAVRPDRRRGEPDPLFNVLHRMHIGRRWGEAKRLFYVAATRARKKIHMSGVLPLHRKDSRVDFPPETPLSWLNDHHTLSDVLGLQGLVLPNLFGEAADMEAEPRDRKSAPSIRMGERECLAGLEKSWQSGQGDFRVLIEPDASEVDAVASTEAFEVVLQPAPFDRERPPLRILKPSFFVSAEQGLDEDPPAELPNARIWGTLIHKLLEAYGEKAELPPLESVAGFLGSAGIERSQAETMARSAVLEVKGCIEDPWLQRFYALPADRRRVEWPLESFNSARNLYVGVIDLAAFDEGRWWLIDFKTSRPASGEDEDSFCRMEIEKYKPQLLAYREMLAEAMGVGKDTVAAVIYWTALRRREGVGSKE